MSDGLLLLRSAGGGPLDAYRWPAGTPVPAGAWYVPREHVRRVLADEFGEHTPPVIIGPTAQVNRLTRERDRQTKWRLDAEVVLMDVCAMAGALDMMDDTTIAQGWQDIAEDARRMLGEEPDDA